jgi:hypothetical protein
MVGTVWSGSVMTAAGGACNVFCIIVFSSWGACHQSRTQIRLQGAAVCIKHFIHSFRDRWGTCINVQHNDFLSEST